MGGSQSAPEVGGFRLFKINPHSPAAEAGLEVFFDFIVEINGTRMGSEQKIFFQKIAESENVRMKLKVFNIRTHATRDVHVTPRRWGGSGLLGAVVRYDVLDNSENQGIRVIDVFPNSPAAHAGLAPNKDFLLGTTEVMFRDMDELGEVVNLCLGKKMQIYVYNSDTEAIREVTLLPNTGWGGEGAIGADIRSGLLHRIPAPRRRSTNAAAVAAAASASAVPTSETSAPSVSPAPLPPSAASGQPVPTQNSFFIGTPIAGDDKAAPQAMPSPVPVTEAAGAVHPAGAVAGLPSVPIAAMPPSYAVPTVDPAAGSAFQLPAAPALPTAVTASQLAAAPPAMPGLVAGTGPATSSKAPPEAGTAADIAAKAALAQAGFSTATAPADTAAAPVFYSAQGVPLEEGTAAYVAAKAAAAAAAAAARAGASTAVAPGGGLGVPGVPFAATGSPQPAVVFPAAHVPTPGPTVEYTGQSPTGPTAGSDVSSSLPTPSAPSAAPTMQAGFPEGVNVSTLVPSYLRGGGAPGGYEHPATGNVAMTAQADYSVTTIAGLHGIQPGPAMPAAPSDLPRVPPPLAVSESSDAAPHAATSASLLPSATIAPGWAPPMPGVLYEAPTPGKIFETPPAATAPPPPLSTLL
eukprot:TRINITY_DN37956_c0_g2_i1.p1 TRINITY_DN37956_c0_g2~~TRINITY_DN37956_c0_g2_i1.p1  ORF type:complete len:634 (+),score=129.65 TRINITY_DN37956_c0_g2_i1:71-1972(+)